MADGITIRAGVWASEVKLVAIEDKRLAGWVRNLIAVKVLTAA
jgi:hypothetical protein